MEADDTVGGISRTVNYDGGVPLRYRGSLLFRKLAIVEKMWRDVLGVIFRAAGWLRESMQRQILSASSNCLMHFFGLGIGQHQCGLSYARARMFPEWPRIRL